MLEVWLDQRARNYSMLKYWAHNACDSEIVTEEQFCSNDWYWCVIKFGYKLNLAGSELLIEFSHWQSRRTVQKVLKQNFVSGKALWVWTILSIVLMNLMTFNPQYMMWIFFPEKIKLCVIILAGSFFQVIKGSLCLQVQEWRWVLLLGVILQGELLCCFNCVL